MAIDRSKMRKSLAARVDESSKNAESGGGNRGFVPYIDEKNLPLPLFKKIPEGAFTFDIIPFQVSEDFLIDPISRRVQYKPDEWYNFLDLHVHTKIGPNNHNIICPKMHLGKNCPICEMADAAQASIEFGDPRWETEVKPFRPKRRGVYQVWIHDKSKDEQDKGVQILEISWHSLERYLVELAKDPETGESIVYTFPGIEGKKISFTRKGTGMSNTSYYGHKLLDRKEEIPDEIFEGTCAINEYIIIMEPKEIQAILDAAPADDEEEEKPRTRTARKPREEEPEEEAQEERKPRRNALGAKKAVKEEESEDEAEEEAPEEEAKPRTRRQLREAKTADEKPKRENPCPSGHRFGVDTDESPDCEECPERKYNACAAKKDNADD